MLRSTLGAALVIASVAAGACNENKSAPKPAAATSSSGAAIVSSASVAPSSSRPWFIADAPTPEAFCAHIDELSRGTIDDADIPAVEKARMLADGRAACLKLSGDDSKKYPEWGPCAKCSMGVTKLDDLEKVCDEPCAKLEAVMPKK